MRRRRMRGWRLASFVIFLEIAIDEDPPCINKNGYKCSVSVNSRPPNQNDR